MIFPCITIWKDSSKVNAIPESVKSKTSHEISESTLFFKNRQMAMDTHARYTPTKKTHKTRDKIFVQTHAPRKVR